MPLYVFPMQPKDHLHGKSGDRAPPRRAESPLVISRWKLALHEAMLCPPRPHRLGW